MVTKEHIVENVKNIIRYIGEDVNREEIQQTPQRVVDSYSEIFKGYKMSLQDITKNTINTDIQDLIVLKNINFYSMCEHHFLPFIGKAYIGYYPQKKIAGLGVFTKIVEFSSRRLQIQEKLNYEIAHNIEKFLLPQGVIVVLKAYHLCLGYKEPDKLATQLVTQSTLGQFKKNNDLTTHFLQHIKD